MANTTPLASSSGTSVANMTALASSSGNGSGSSSWREVGVDRSHVATLHRIPLNGGDDPTVSLMADLVVEPGVCIDCLAASGSIVALGRSDNCSAGGAVTLWSEMQDGTGWTEAATIVDPGLEASMGDRSGRCGFGRVVRLQASLLFVGVPDANEGDGAVTVHDISDPSNPRQLCQWDAPAEGRSCVRNGQG